MTVFINGAPQATAVRTVAALVEELGFPAPTLLIEHNGTALTRSEWAEATLSDGDRLELLRVTAGG